MAAAACRGTAMGMRAGAGPGTTMPTTIRTITTMTAAAAMQMLLVWFSPAFRGAGRRPVAGRDADRLCPGLCGHLDPRLVPFVPLGQTEGQALLARLMPAIARIVAEAQAAEEGTGRRLPALRPAAIRHETLGHRNFRT